MGMNGVPGYKVYTSHAVVAIPEDKDLCCKLCRHCRTDDRMRQRCVCGETMEIIWDVNRVGEWCPLDEALMRGGGVTKTAGGDTDEA